MESKFIKKRNLTADKLKIGMEVLDSELDNILDTYIILGDVKLVDISPIEKAYQGKIVAISNKLIHPSKEGQTLVFNDSFSRQEYCHYE